YYMCTKFFSDGDVHSYFNPYDSPYDAFINYMNVLSDFKLRINEKKNIFADKSELLKEELTKKDALILQYKQELDDLKAQFEQAE
ncbi:MAG: alpha-amylase, partial [Marinifilum sp.]|nr:alpha-amylase [Marinifilum sp.]